MSTRKKRTASNVPLPWEGRHAWIAQLFSLRRVRPLLIAGAVVMAVIAAYDQELNRLRE